MSSSPSKSPSKPALPEAPPSPKHYTEQQIEHHLATHYHSQAFLKPYSNQHRFFPISEKAYGDAWDMYREIFPPPGCCFNPAPPPPGSIQPPAAEKPTRTAAEQMAITIAEEAGVNAAQFHTCPFPTSYTSLPKANDGSCDLMSLALKRYQDSIERAGYAGSPTHVALIMYSPLGKRSICFVDISKMNGISYPHSTQTGGAVPKLNLPASLKLAEVQTPQKA